MLPSFLHLATLMFACLEGCGKVADKDLGGGQAQGGDKGELAKKLSSMNSANWYLGVGDLDEFQAGRSKSALLRDVQWRGWLYMAAEYKGKTVSEIMYSLLSDDPSRHTGVSAYAIFVDDKFVKFVKPPPVLPGDQEIVGYSKSGAPFSRPKPLKAGDDRFLIRAMDSEAVSIADLKKELESTTPPPKEHIDPGLTAAFLLMRAFGLVPGPGPAASEKDYLRNAELRDQFNAARLDIGMTEAEVEIALKAKPLESGKVEAGPYKIYGSNEWFDLDMWLQFSNILVIFREGKAVAISSIPARYDWRRELAKATVDLPVPARP